MAGNKRPSIDGGGDGGHPVKHPRFDLVAEHPGSAKRKAAGATRTGQACDRCKVRKIRCDARPGGCSPCLQNNTECRTTDRITGRATSRGHTEHIENENASLRLYMVELQQQLRDHGVEPKPAPPAQPDYAPMAAEGRSASLWTSAQETSWDTPTSEKTAASAQDRPDRKPSSGGLLPDFRPGCIGDNYLGVSSETNWLSPIEGTSLALFGMKIDLAEFMPPETNLSSADMSYQTFLDLAFGKTKPLVPALPSWEKCKFYADIFFRSVQIFIPILDRSDFMRLLQKIHHESYTPTPAETVMVHMMLAILNFQFSARNANEQARLDSMSHYHYALSLIPDLITAHKLEDIQALTLICFQLRNQPRPAAAWMFTNTVMGIAIESGLHRSAKAWQTSGMAKDPHHLEMRKRTFWSLFLFHVHISGKLGRPMPLRFEDFDIEIPENVADNPPEEFSDNPWKNCSFRAGIEGFKLLRVMHQIYATIYSVRSTGQYESNVRQFGKDLEAFQEQLPEELRGGPKSKDEDRVAALYLDMSVAECRLLLHHPSLCRSPSTSLMNNNLDTCLHWSSRLLSSAMQLKELTSLDTSWFYSTDYLAAIFTTLFAYYERRDQITLEHLQTLKDDMNLWVDIMGAIGVLLGSGPRLQNSIRNIVDTSLGHISRHLAAKTASAAVASTTSSDPEQAPSQQVYAEVNQYNNDFRSGTSNGSSEQHETKYQEQHPPQPQLTTTYPPNAQYNFPDGQRSSLTAYNTESISPYTASSYTATEDSKPAAYATQITPIATPATSTYLNPYQSPNAPTSASFHHTPPHAPGQSAWRSFTDTMMTNAGGVEYMTSAGALVALGTTGVDHKNGHAAGVSNGGSTPLNEMALAPGTNIPAAGALGAAPVANPGVNAPAQIPWPMIVFTANGGTVPPHLRC